jgi:hypothetical protein
LILFAFLSPWPHFPHSLSNLSAHQPYRLVPFIAWSLYVTALELHLELSDVTVPNTQLPSEYTRQNYTFCHQQETHTHNHKAFPATGICVYVLYRAKRNSSAGSLHKVIVWFKNIKWKYYT